MEVLPCRWILRRWTTSEGRLEERQEERRQRRRPRGSDRAGGATDDAAASLSVDPSVLEQGRLPWLRVELPLLRQPPAEVHTGVDLGATASSRCETTASSRCGVTASSRRSGGRGAGGPRGSSHCCHPPTSTSPPLGRLLLPCRAWSSLSSLPRPSSPPCCWRGPTTASRGPRES
jgi:hypothetical protein